MAEPEDVAAAVREALFKDRKMHADYFATRARECEQRVADIHATGVPDKWMRGFIEHQNGTVYVLLAKQFYEWAQEALVEE